jgi:hypothetical protein
LRRHFTPFVVSNDGFIKGTLKAAKALLKKLSSLLPLLVVIAAVAKRLEDAAQVCVWCVETQNTVLIEQAEASASIGGYRCEH